MKILAQFSNASFPKILNASRIVASNYFNCSYVSSLRLSQIREILLSISITENHIKSGYFLMNYFVFHPTSLTENIPRFQ